MDGWVDGWMGGRGLGKRRCSQKKTRLDVHGEKIVEARGRLQPARLEHRPRVLRRQEAQAVSLGWWMGIYESSGVARLCGGGCV